MNLRSLSQATERKAHLRSDKLWSWILGIGAVALILYIVITAALVAHRSGFA